MSEKWEEPELRLNREVERLRALLKEKEFCKVGGDYDEGDGYSSAYEECPWCGRDAVQRHAADCLAFTPDGVVK